MYMAKRISHECKMGSQTLVEFILKRDSLRIFRDDFRNNFGARGKG